MPLVNLPFDFMISGYCIMLPNGIFKLRGALIVLVSNEISVTESGKEILFFLIRFGIGLH